MKCHEVLSLIEPYLDSELDTRTNADIQQHLADCAECAKAFAAEEKTQAQLISALRNGEATPALWARIEHLVRQTQEAPDKTGEPKPQTGPSLTRDVEHRRQPSKETERGWRAWLWPSPPFAAGLAAVWAIILALHFLAAEGPSARGSEAQVLAPQASRALAEQRRALMELLEVAEVPQSESASPIGSPQSSICKPGGEVQSTTYIPVARRVHRV